MTFLKDCYPPPCLMQKTPFDTEEEYRRTHILRRVNAAGIAGYRAGDFWQGIAGTPKKEIRRIAGILCEEGLLRRLEIEGSGREWFISSGTLEAASSASSAPSGRAVLLAPLDNMMWNRDLLEDIFDFRYRWEVYTPAAKREYGYYVLPILFRGKDLSGAVSLPWTASAMYLYSRDSGFRTGYIQHPVIMKN